MVINLSELQRERDLVLNPNEYAYVLDKTKGLISCVVGSYKMSLSTSDALVVFNEHTKRFIEAGFHESITTFVSAPENWYITLKNPAVGDKHPTPGTANPLPELQIGKKVNICGNVSFALYPGQMAKAIQGHRLHSNQYLLARVYDADVFDGNYTIGQLLVIKGTEVSFYIPPTGIEVLPLDSEKEQYIRDAVTLERLEYCILKDEQGNKKYIHGAAVVFPEPDETFVKTPSGGYKFRAIELSDISGIYVKVITDYSENGVDYKTGQELFITGKDQMIYYPRPEHAIINYDGKVLHHAVAIPVGEGRYVLDRKTGNIKTIKGAAMYLPDPRYEVIVKRKLTFKQCILWYPGNEEVLKYNVGIEETPPEPGFFRSDILSQEEIDNLLCCLNADEETVVEEGGFSRDSNYTQPRMITIDNKYDGVVSIDIWTGYAIHVISKNGNRKIITGAQTYLMDYDETLEVIELSKGCPKTSSQLLKTVYLRIENNKISDSILVRTKDFVTIQIQVSYCVDFLPEYQEKWFSVENYVKYLCDRQRSLLKKEVSLYTIEQFYENASDIIRKAVLNLSSSVEEDETPPARQGRFFPENGMLVHDVEVLHIEVEEKIAKMLDSHQQKIVEKTLTLSNTNKELQVITQLAHLERTKAELEHNNKQYQLELEQQFIKEKLKQQEAIKRLQEEAELASQKAKQEIQILLDSIQTSELTRLQEKHSSELTYQKEKNHLEIEKQQALTEAMKQVIESISPDLISAMLSSSNAELLSNIAQTMSPYAIANGESVSDVINTLLRGTSLEGILEKLGMSDSAENKIEN